jgi:xanthine permease XanP
MAKKPAGLIYGVEDRPPLPTLALLAVQHIFLMSSTLVLPIVLVTEIGGDFKQVTAVVALTMISCGIGTILQAMRWRGIARDFSVRTCAVRTSSPLRSQRPGSAACH